MRQLRTVLITGASAVLALALGFVGLSLLFSDLGPDETMSARIVTAFAFYTIAGFILGFLNQERWWLAGLVAWGAVLLGLTAVIGNIGRGLELFLESLALFLPLLISLTAGFGGHTLRRYYRQRTPPSNHLPD